MLLEITGNLAMKHARDRRRNRPQRCFEDQVVRERVLAYHLRAFELAPTFRQIEWMRAKDLRRQLD